MRVLVTGSHGLIGTALVASLQADGHNVTRLVRGLPEAGEAAEVAWDPYEGTIDAAGLEAHDAVVHLAGAGIGDRRWTARYKRQVLDSRVQTTALLSTTLAAIAEPPAVLVSGSAVGYYGDRGDEQLTEDSAAGDGFLAAVVRKWENSTEAASAAGIRVVHIRSGIVQSPSGGALSRLVPPFKLGAGGRFGSGRQWLSWVHIDDEVGAIRFAIDHADLSGPLNATSPEPVTNGDYARALGRALHRPALLPLPGLALEVILGRERAKELVLSGQRVLPAKLQAAGYTFRYPQLDSALAAVFA